MLNMILECREMTVKISVVGAKPVVADLPVKGVVNVPSFLKPGFYSRRQRCDSGSREFPIFGIFVRFSSEQPEPVSIS